MVSVGGILGAENELVGEGSKFSQRFKYLSTRVSVYFRLLGCLVIWWRRLSVMG